MVKPNLTRQTAALVEAGMALASEFDLEALLQRIADLAKEVVGAKYGAVGVIAEDGSLARFVYSGIDDETAALIGPLPTGRGVLGALIEEGRPLRLREISDHPRSFGFPDHHPPMHSFLGVPIVVRGQVFGRLYLTEKGAGEEFTKDDERIALTLASQAGVAIENARLLEELRDRGQALAILQERERISKELHDGVIQSIYSVGLSLQAAISLMEGDAEASADRIDSAIGELDKVVRDVRSYIFELRPKELAKKGLDEAIGDLVKEFEVNTMATVALELDDEATAVLSPQVGAEVVQILHELMSNIARHGQPTQVELASFREDGAIVFDLNDDGTQYDPKTVKRGEGLNNVESRATDIGGDLSIDKRPARGMRHTLRIPVETA
jgi:signal transduction histidine kinase